jgi:hypothetical protein
MAEQSSAIFWVLCPEQSLHCYIMKIFIGVERDIGNVLEYYGDKFSQ